MQMVGRYKVPDTIQVLRLLLFMPFHNQIIFLEVGQRYRKLAKPYYGNYGWSQDHYSELYEFGDIRINGREATARNEGNATQYERILQCRQTTSTYNLYTEAEKNASDAADMPVGEQME